MLARKSPKAHAWPHRIEQPQHILNCGKNSLLGTSTKGLTTAVSYVIAGGDCFQDLF